MIKDNNTASIIPLPRIGAYNAEREAQANVIGERIREARKAKKLSGPKFTELLSHFGVKITRQSAARWETGQCTPNAYQLLAICHALDIKEGLSNFDEGFEWPTDKLNEEGRRKVEEYEADLIATGLYRPKAAASELRTITGIPRIRYIEVDISTLAASAGTGDFLDSGSFEKVSFPEKAVPTNADFGIRVNGDSMEPVYHDGQIVWVQRCETLDPGEVGIFEYDGNGYLKEYDEQEPDAGCAEEYTDSNGSVHMQPVLVSYNEKYAPIVVSPNAPFRIAGRVVT